VGIIMPIDEMVMVSIVSEGVGWVAHDMRWNFHRYKMLESGA
jgi:hypothetical protein